MSEGCVVVKGDFAIQGNDATIDCLDQGVDLNQGRVLALVDLPEADEDGGEGAGFIF